MRRDVFANACGPCVFFENLPETQARHAAAAIGDKEIVTPFAAKDMRTSTVQIVLNFTFCGITERNEPFFVAFAHDPDKTSVKVAGDQR